MSNAGKAIDVGGRFVAALGLDDGWVKWGEKAYEYRVSFKKEN